MTSSPRTSPPTLLARSRRHLAAIAATGILMTGALTACAANDGTDGSTSTDTSGTSTSTTDASGSGTSDQGSSTSDQGSTSSSDQGLTTSDQGATGSTSDGSSAAS